MPAKILPVGKLPIELLEGLISQAPTQDARLVLGPGIGLDCAVIDAGPTLMVYKSDPITFATTDIGWYAVQVNANDIATSGAQPRWFLLTVLLPAGQTTEELVQQISAQVNQACRDLGITVIGGHTEITQGLRRPILVGTMIGEVTREKLVTPRGAKPGDRILLTKGIPIEATTILAREFPQRLASHLSADQIRQAAQFLYNPGISVVRDARIALQAGQVTAMHDPTEGGLASALWELAQASNRCLVIDRQAVTIPALSQRICQAFDLDPLAAIASGALLLTTPQVHAQPILKALESEGIACTEIGCVEAGPAAVWQKSTTGREPLSRPERDEIAKLFEEMEIPVYSG
jgi:hydrogenase expression/formation protein HypE